MTPTPSINTYLLDQEIHGRPGDVAVVIDGRVRIARSAQAPKPLARAPLPVPPLPKSQQSQRSRKRQPGHRLEPRQEQRPPRRLELREEIMLDFRAADGGWLENLKERHLREALGHECALNSSLLALRRMGYLEAKESEDSRGYDYSLTLEGKAYVIDLEKKLGRHIASSPNGQAGPVQSELNLDPKIDTTPE